MPLSDNVKRWFRRAVANSAIANVILDLLDEVAAATRPVPTKWFFAVIKDSVVTATPGTWSPAAGGPFQRAACENGQVITYIHLHLDEAHAVGTLAGEVWLNRGQTYGPGSSYGTMTRIATNSVDGGEADGASLGFTYLDESYKQLQAGDYLHFQPTSKPSGSAWSASVDVHYAWESIL